MQFLQKKILLCSLLLCDHHPCLIVGQGMLSRLLVSPSLPLRLHFVSHLKHCPHPCTLALTLSHSHSPTPPFSLTPLPDEMCNSRKLYSHWTGADRQE